jgi:uncharacterized membrane protein YfcA
MDGFALTFFLVAAFFGGLVSGLSGFAMGIVVSGIWLHIISPEQNALLIALSGLVTQGSGIWRVWKSLDWRKVGIIIVGSAIGIPIGTVLLTRLDPVTLRTGIGVLLLAFGLYGLLRPAMKPIQSGAATNLSVGLANGLIAGLTGLGGIAVTVWTQLMGGSKDAQRAIFQPVILTTFAMSAVSFAFAGLYTVETLRLYLFALPVLGAGIWCGLQLYGKLDDAGFRKVILWLLLASGLSLVVPVASLPQWIGALPWR